MRIVGYVRQSADPAGSTAFAQQEQLRRYAVDQGHSLVAVCQDIRSAGSPPSRDGYTSMLGVVAAGGVDAVVVPGVATLSSDAIVQEIMLRDLRSRGVRILSTDPSDLGLLDESTSPDADRLVIRDVLERVEEHTAAISSHQRQTIAPKPDTDVIVEIIAADAAEG